MVGARARVTLAYFRAQWIFNCAQNSREKPTKVSVSFLALGWPPLAASSLSLACNGSELVPSSVITFNLGAFGRARARPLYLETANLAAPLFSYQWALISRRPLPLRRSDALAKPAGFVTLVRFSAIQFRPSAFRALDTPARSPVIFHSSLASISSKYHAVWPGASGPQQHGCRVVRRTNQCCAPPDIGRRQARRRLSLAGPWLRSDALGQLIRGGGQKVGPAARTYS